MVTGFEKETHPLTELELKVILPYMVSKLNHNVGHANRVKASKIIEKVNTMLKARGYKNRKNNPLKLSGPRFRQIIHEIRLKSLVPNLIATNEGYWVATKQEEIDDYINSLKERSNSFLEIWKSMKDYNTLNPLK